MIVHRALALLVSGLFLAGCTARRGGTPSSPPSAPSSFKALEAQVRARIAREAPGEISVDVIDIATGRTLAIDADKSMHAASTMKVPVLLELFRQSNAGHFSLDDSIVVKNTFKSIADGSSFSAVPAEDSEQPLYGMVGRKTTIRDLILRMITRSSDLATNNLIELVTPDSIQRTMRLIGAAGVNVLRGVQDTAAFRKGMNNTTTAAGLARVLESIARCDAATPAACSAMVDILSRQEFNEMIPAGLPKGTRVAHKTGWITGIQHDAAIVYPQGRPPYILVVLTRGIADTLVARRAAADISRMVWGNVTMAGGTR
jgi:beta-lactamase class A